VTAGWAPGTSNVGFSTNKMAQVDKFISGGLYSAFLL